MPEFLKKYLSQEQFDLVVSVLAPESLMSREQFESIYAAMLVAKQEVSNQFAAIPRDIPVSKATIEEVRMLSREGEGVAMVFQELANKIRRGEIIKASGKPH